MFIAAPRGSGHFGDEVFMRPASLCSLLVVIFANAGNASAVDYCPLQLQGQFGNNYYYYCQTVQGGNCTYTFAMVGIPYQCGGCCDTCCDQACVNGFQRTYDEKTTAKMERRAKRAADAQFEDSEVLPLRNFADPKDKGEDYASADERFCTPGSSYKVDEVWLEVTHTNGNTYYFRCFDVTNMDRPREKLRIGRQIEESTWKDGPKLTTNPKRQADYDTRWPHISAAGRFHRVTLNDTIVDKPVDANDHRPFYLISKEVIR